MRPLALVASVGCMAAAALVGAPGVPFGVVSAPEGVQEVASVLYRGVPKVEESAREHGTGDNAPAKASSGGSDGPSSAGGGGGNGTTDAPAAGVSVTPADGGGDQGGSPPRGVPLVVPANGYVFNGTVRIEVDPTALGTAEQDAVVLERQLATLVDGSCVGFGDWEPTSESNVIPDGSCARYRLRVVSSGGDEQFFTSPSVIRHDETAPMPPVLTLAEAEPDEHVSGTTLFYNPKSGNTGSFTVTATSEDPESGLERLDLPAVFADDASSGAAPAQTTYSWTEGAAKSGPQTVTAVNTAGAESIAVFTVTPDTEGPTGGGVSYPDGIVATGSVSVAVDPGIDALSGVDAATGVLERRAGAPAGGSCQFPENWSTASGSDPLPAGPACVQYRYRVSDNVGNETVYASTSVVQVPDTVRPMGSIVSPAPGSWVHGVVEVVASVSDEGSGVAQVVFQAAPAGTGEWTEIGVATGGSWSVSWDTTGLAEADYDLRALTTDGGGNTDTSATVTVSVDNGAPDAEIRVPGHRLDGVVGLSAEGSDERSGVASVEIQIAAEGGAWQTVASGEGPDLETSLDTTHFENGNYTIRSVVRDRAGNEASSREVAVKIENEVAEEPLPDEDEEVDDDDTTAPGEETPPDDGSGTVEEPPAGGDQPSDGAASGDQSDGAQTDDGDQKPDGGGSKPDDDRAPSADSGGGNDCPPPGGDAPAETS